MSQPIQAEHVFPSVAQPGRNFSHLKRLVSRAEVAIEQLCDFLSRARLFDLVQGSQDMLVEMVVRIWNLAHLRFSVLKADLLKGAHFVFDLVLQEKNSGSRGTGRYQLELSGIDAPRQHGQRQPCGDHLRDLPVVRWEKKRSTP